MTNAKSELLSICKKMGYELIDRTFMVDGREFAAFVKVHGTIVRAVKNGPRGKWNFS
jgi:hypothetical protein